MALQAVIIKGCMERVITKKYLMNELGAKCWKKVGNSGIALWDQRRFLNLLTFRL